MVFLQNSGNMAMSMKTKNGAVAGPALRPRLRMTCGKEIAFGPGKADLLELIARTGSIRKAASRMSMSYMRAWSLLRTMNRSFKQPLVEAIRGGSRHGGATLTPAGTRVLNLYRQMEAASLKSVQADWRKMRKLLRD